MPWQMNNTFNMWTYLLICWYILKNPYFSKDFNFYNLAQLYHNLA